MILTFFAVASGICNKNSECRFCLMLCLKFWVYDMCLLIVPENSHRNKSGNSLNNSNEPYEAHIVPRVNLVFVAAIDYDPEYKIRIVGHWINHFHL